MEMDKERRSLEGMMHKTKICDFQSSGLGGYCFTFVTLHSRDDLELYAYYFEADCVMVDHSGKFVSGAILTYAPYKTLEEAMRRWDEFDRVHIEAEDGSDIEKLAKKIIAKYDKRKTPHD